MANLTTLHPVNKSTVYDVAEKPADAFEWLTVPTLALVYVLFTGSAVDTTSAMWAFLALVAAVWVRFVCAAISQITGHLNIKLLSIPYNKKDRVCRNACGRACPRREP